MNVYGVTVSGTDQVKVKFYLRQPVDERIDGLHVRYEAGAGAALAFAAAFIACL